jgi:flagellar hook-associated protein 3 FlgL
MQFRITDSAVGAALVARIGVTRRQIADAQERVASGKRINRPSDDPTGAEAVMRLRAARAEIAHYRRNTETVRERLAFGDAALDSYEQSLDRVRVLLMQGASDSTGAEARGVIATELEGIRDRLLAEANARIDEQYLFGGTRQAEPPFDPLTAAPSALTSAPALIQVEPGGLPVTSGVTAEAVFSDAAGTVFAMLTDVAAALRGTGDPVADRQNVSATLDRVGNFGALASTARARIGVGLEGIEAANARHERNDLMLEAAAQNLEGADFAEAATQLVEANRALEATLQAGAQYGRRSLIDFLG